MPPVDAGAETYYFYFVDELTMLPIYPEHENDPQYPVEIKEPGKTMKKLLPLMNVALKGAPVPILGPYFPLYVPHTEAPIYPPLNVSPLSDLPPWLSQGSCCTTVRRASRSAWAGPSPRSASHAHMDAYDSYI